MLTIDGSYGEGGGQILRSSLSLSVVTGRPCRIVNIRAGREKPGLLRQHLTALRAAGRISRARVTGDEIGSREVTFEPGAVQPGSYRFAVGTAGSTSLVLQTILPALVTAADGSVITLEGGTHNPQAPPFEFLEKAFLPIINRMGPQVQATLQRAGFFPAGGGAVTVTVSPCAGLQALDLRDRGAMVAGRAKAVVANLPRHIAEREIQVIRSGLGWPADCLAVEELVSPGPGNIVIVEVQSEHVTEVFSAVGRRGVRAERVAEEVVTLARSYLQSPAAVGTQLADQLLLPVALAGGGSFTTLPLSEHARTNIAVLQQFMDIAIEVDAAQADTGGAVIVRVGPGKC